MTNKGVNNFFSLTGQVGTRMLAKYNIVIFLCLNPMGWKYAAKLLINKK